jgi:hypothetical protein
MFSTPLRYLSILGSLIVLASFGAFAIDQIRSGSQTSTAGIEGTQVVKVNDPAGYADPTPAQERLREQLHGSVREVIDDADDVAVAPFAGISSSSSSAWVRRGVPALIGLFVYGFGLAFLARFAAGRA